MRANSLINPLTCDDGDSGYEPGDTFGNSYKSEWLQLEISIHRLCLRWENFLVLYHLAQQGHDSWHCKCQENTWTPMEGREKVFLFLSCAFREENLKEFEFIPTYSSTIQARRKNGRMVENSCVMGMDWSWWCHGHATAGSNFLQGHWAKDKGKHTTPVCTPRWSYMQLEAPHSHKQRELLTATLNCVWNLWQNHGIIEKKFLKIHFLVHEPIDWFLCFVLSLRGETFWDFPYCSFYFITFNLCIFMSF